MTSRAIFLFAGLALGFAGFSGGCLSQRPLALREKDELQRRAVPPESIGLTPLLHPGSFRIEAGERLFANPPVTLPQWRQSGELPAVGVRFNGGRPERVVIDTGSMFNVVRASVALRDRVEVADPARWQHTFRGLAGEEALYMGRVGQIECGPLRGTNVPAAIRLTAGDHGFYGRAPTAQTILNLLGLPTLARFSWFTLNQPAGTLTFATDAEFPVPGPKRLAARVPLEFENMKLFVRLRVNGTNEVRAQVDTGNMAALMINSRCLADLGLTALAGRGMAQNLVALGGEATFIRFVVPQIALGAATFPNIPVLTGDGPFDVLLGNGLLRHYKTTFDFRRNILWLEHAR